MMQLFQLGEYYYYFTVTFRAESHNSVLETIIIIHLYLLAVSRCSSTENDLIRLALDEFARRQINAAVITLIWRQDRYVLSCTIQEKNAYNLCLCIRKVKRGNSRQLHVPLTRYGACHVYNFTSIVNRTGINAGCCS